MPISKATTKAVVEIGTWEQKRVMEVIGAVHTAGDIVREWDQGHFKAAAMLHTDAAMEKLEADEPQAAFHLQVASRLLVTGGAPLRGFARTWYLTAARLLRDRARLLVAEGLLSIGRRHLPGDAVVLYESAVTQESIASHSAFVTETVVSTRPFAGSAQDVRNLDNTPVTGSDRKFTAWRAAMDNAARWLAEALQADPSSELAQLHLGRGAITAWQTRRSIDVAAAARRYQRRNRRRLPRDRCFWARSTSDVVATTTPNSSIVGQWFGISPPKAPTSRSARSCRGADAGRKRGKRSRPCCEHRPSREPNRGGGISSNQSSMSSIARTPCASRCGNDTGRDD